MSEQTIQWIIGQGVAVGVLMWFMARMEKRIDMLIFGFQELCLEVNSSKPR